MRALTIFLKLLAPVPVLVGLFHFFMGAGADALLGAKLPAEVLSDPVLDSQNRFYGTVFMGYGVLVFLCAADLRKYASILRTAAAFIFLGGVARMISVFLHGLPTPPVVALIAIELIGMPLLLWWHTRVLRNNAAGN